MFVRSLAQDGVVMSAQVFNFVRLCDTWTQKKTFCT